MVVVVVRPPPLVTEIRMEGLQFAFDNGIFAHFFFYHYSQNYFDCSNPKYHVFYFLLPSLSKTHSFLNLILLQHNPGS